MASNQELDEEILKKIGNNQEQNVATKEVNIETSDHNYNYDVDLRKLRWSTSSMLR